MPLVSDCWAALCTTDTAGNSGPASKTWVDAAIAITPATATNAVGTNHTLTITVTAVGTTVGNGTATASITSGPGSFVGSPTCSYTGGGSRADDNTSVLQSLTRTTFGPAPSYIPLTGAGSVTRTTDVTAGNIFSSCNTCHDATLSFLHDALPISVGTNHTLTITVTAVGTTVGNGSATASITSGPGSFVGSPTCSYTGGGS